MEKRASTSQLSPKVLKLEILHIWAIFVKANYKYSDNRVSWSPKVKRVLEYFLTSVKSKTSSIYIVSYVSPVKKVAFCAEAGLVA